MITPQTVQRIVDAALVEEVVGEFVTLRRRGSNMTGLCPFHNEKTPSFSVSPSKGIFKCFGCGKSGDSVRFVMEHENYSYPEALRWLAAKYKIEIEETVYSQEIKDEKLRLDALFLANEFAQKYYENQLFHTDYGKSIGLSYFKQRGLRESTIEQFGLGFAAEGQSFTAHARANQYTQEQLLRAGLTRTDGRDFFRNRVLFPIHNLSGRVVAFGGRVMSNEIQPKYLNTGETEIYTKSKLLYGIFFAKKAIRQLDECILTEGYLDVVSLVQAGIENVVASSGTSLTVEQIQLIRRHTPNVKILYDGDAAGIKAALRGLDLVLEQGLNVKVVLLPDGEDPDSYVQKIGGERFKEFIQREAKDFIIFKTQVLLKETDNDPIKRVKVLHDIIESIAKIPDSIARAVYIRACGELMKMSESVLVEEVNKLIIRSLQKAKAAQIPHRTAETADIAPVFDEQNPLKEPLPEKNIERGDVYQERAILRVLILFGDAVLSTGNVVAHFILSTVADVLEHFEDDFCREILLECTERAHNDLPINAAFFTSHPDSAVREQAINFLSFYDRFPYSENWVNKKQLPLNTQPLPDLNFERDTLYAVRHLRFRKIIKLLEKNRLELQKTPPEDENFIILLHLQQRLLAARTELTMALNIQGAI